jgi:hypothetical protein
MAMFPGRTADRFDLRWSLGTMTYELLMGHVSEICWAIRSPILMVDTSLAFVADAFLGKQSLGYVHECASQ